MYSPIVYIRPLESRDQPMLWEMLYQAIYVAPGEALPERDILHQPDIRRYAADWMQQDGDAGFAAEQDGQTIGAVWIRCWTSGNKGYGFIDTAIPELSIALLPAYRGKGIGTKLLRHCISEVGQRFPAVSLSVSMGNPAKRLYLREGFMATGDGAGESVTMVKYLTEHTGTQ